MVFHKTTLGIIGNGPALLAVLAQLYAQNVRSVNVVVFSKSRLSENADFSLYQQQRISRLRCLGIDFNHFVGAGTVWNPADPATYTLNGDHQCTAMEGIPFPDYLDWLNFPVMRLLVRWIYPEWLAKHSNFWDEPDATSPRGLVGIWLHCQFWWVLWLLFLRGVIVQTVKTREGVTLVQPAMDMQGSVSYDFIYSTRNRKITLINEG